MIRPHVDVRTPLVTVAICTLDRHDDVRRCITGFLTQDAQAHLFEVLVVDNGPSQGISDVVSEFADAPFVVRYAREPRRGLTYARRTAWKSALGTFVGYVDDDAVVAPGWVSAAINGFDLGGPAIAVLGGPTLNLSAAIDPLPFTPSPGVAGLDLGPEYRRLTEHENLWGCNMVFRRSVLAALDAFGEPLGHRDGRPGANEDILVQRQIDLLGLGRAYSPLLQIVHLTWRMNASPRQQSRLAYFTGIDNATMNRLLTEHSPSRRLAAISSRLTRLRAQTGALARARRDGDPVAAEAARLAALQSLGSVVGYAWPPLRPSPKPRD